MPLANPMLEKAAILSARTMLLRLAHHGTTVNKWFELPLVTLHCRSGRALHGHLLRINTRDSNPSVLLTQESSSGNKGELTILTYVQLDEVMAVDVHRAETVRPIITAGAVAAIPDGPVPSQFELKREVASLSLGVEWDGVPESEVGRVGLQSLARAVSEAMGRTGADTLGQAAIASAGPVTIRHVADSNLEVTRTDGGIRVDVDLERQLPTLLADEVRRLMENVMVEGNVGLAERRVIEQFRSGPYEAWRRDLAETLGFEVPIEVAWDTLTKPGYQLAEIPTWFRQVYFEPIARALKSIGADDTGRQALRRGLAKIIVQDSDEYASPHGITFENGVLTYDHKFSTNVDDVEDRAEALLKLLEAKL